MGSRQSDSFSGASCDICIQYTIRAQNNEFNLGPRSFAAILRKAVSIFQLLSQFPLPPLIA